ncbi:SDR family NAD(P)-dependent oxidoreductase [Streptomyces sp. NPDC005301]|uniref:SDR family NAD(P)-dependent oxidoreductase n=1 Tax=Streptomyces sp. NPDC005301 TaxID=3156874 RepID=UPI0033B09C4D
MAMPPSVTTPFGAHSTASDVLAGVDLTGRRAVITGATGGLGRETARALAAAGAEVTVTGRTPQAAAAVAQEIAAETGNPRTRAGHLDLADPTTVTAFAAAWTGPLHILVDNAGIMATPEQRTPAGRELQFATNHLGHFALTVLLHDALAAAGDARVVVVSSVGHVNGPVRFDDPDFIAEPYDPWLAYAQSKTANILFAVETARRWAADGIGVNALNPGRIWETGLSRHMDAPPASFDPSGASGVSEKTIAQGAATSVLLASSPLVDGVTGKYFEDCQEAGPYTPGVRRGVADYALDPDNARRLWDLSVQLTIGDW